jgi:hypothetical protein
MTEIAINKKEYDRLIKKYKASKGAIDRFIKQWSDYFQKNPFKEERRNVWCPIISDHIEFYNPKGKGEKLDPETFKKTIRKTYKQILEILRYYIDLKEDDYVLIAIW